MEDKIFTATGTENDSFCIMLKRAQSGDNQALIEIIEFLEPDMEYLACFIKMSREDSIQEMKVAMIEAIRQGEIWPGST
ncbi:helix-turn-helix domain-containing protein [Brevibacillus laterosporus]|uniref:helix-turn-helix domain-containing protein n=1 Tax=Brevibacillus laterosporus TaxID=1465 RepID=UPI0035A6F05A